MNTQLERKFTGVIHNFSSFLLRMNLENCIEYLERASEMERFFIDGLQKYLPHKDLSRLTYLRKIFQEAIRDPSIMNMMTVVLDDQKLIKTLLDAASVARNGAHSFTNLAGVRFTMAGDSIKEIFSNYNIGLARGRANVFKRYISNVHVFAQLLRDPQPLIGAVTMGLGVDKAVLNLTVVLEGLSVTTSKMSDMTVWIEDLPELFIDFANKSISLPIPKLRVPVTFDSKVVKDAGGIFRAFNQQFDLVLSDRIETIIKPMLTAVNESKEILPRSLTLAKQAALKKYVKYMFHHYIFTTSDFVISDAAVAAFNEQIQAELSGRIRFLMQDYSEADIQLLEDTLGQWLHEFILNKDFIITNSKLTYK